MISLIVKDVRFKVYSANTSITSKAAPDLIIYPIQIPIKAPPKIEISSLSDINATSGISTR